MPATETGPSPTEHLQQLQTQARELALHPAMRRLMRQAFEDFQDLIKESEQVQVRNARRELELAVELLSRGKLKDPATDRGARALPVRLHGLCPVELAAGRENLASDRLDPKERRQSVRHALEAARWELDWQSRDLPEDKREAMFAERRARLASKQYVEVHWDLWLREPDDWQEPRNLGSPEPSKLQEFNEDEYLTIALYWLAGLADTGSGHLVIPQPVKTGDAVEDMRRYAAWRMRFISSWDDARRPDPVLRPTRLDPKVAEHMLQVIRARYKLELSGTGEQSAEVKSRSALRRSPRPRTGDQHVTPDALRLIARSAAVYIRGHPSAFHEAAAWFAAVPMLPTEAPPEFVCPLRHRLDSAWVEVFRRYSALPKGERYHGLSDEKCRRILLVLALAFDPDFDGHEVGLEPLPWELPGQEDSAFFGRGALSAAVSPDPETACWSDPVWGAVQLAVKLLGVTARVSTATASGENVGSAPSLDKAKAPVGQPRFAGFQDAVLKRAGCGVTCSWQYMQLGLVAIEWEAKRGPDADLARMRSIASDATRIFDGPLGTHLPAGCLDGGGPRSQIAHSSAQQLSALLAGIPRRIHDEDGLKFVATTSGNLADWIEGTLRPVYGTAWCEAGLESIVLAAIEATRPAVDKVHDGMNGKSAPPLPQGASQHRGCFGESGDLRRGDDGLPEIERGVSPAAADGYKRTVRHFSEIKTLPAKPVRENAETDDLRSEDLQEAELSNMERFTLIALVELNAVSQSSRRTTDEVSNRAGYGKQAGGTFKQCVSGLGRRGFVQSRGGRDGGIWISPDGLARAMTEHGNSTGNGTD